MNKRWNWKALVFSVDPSFTTVTHLLFEDRLSVLRFCIQVRFYLTIAGATSQSGDIFGGFLRFICCSRELGDDLAHQLKKSQTVIPFLSRQHSQGLSPAVRILNLQMKLKTNKNRNHPLSFLVVDMLC